MYLVINRGIGENILRRNSIVKSLRINKVRHLSGIEIPVSSNERKHIIFTGKNGSGKTSLLDEISDYLNRLMMENDSPATDNINSNVEMQFFYETDHIRNLFREGEFIIAYYTASRQFHASVPRHVEKVSLKDHYSITDSPRNEFIKYLLDLKVTEALSKTSGKNDRAEQIHSWFIELENLLKQVLDEESTKLAFDEDTFSFSIRQKDREPFDFNCLSDGFAAVLDIIVDIMMRMEKHTSGAFQFDMPGIVLIDEIEIHLHLELQKQMLHLLTTLFPNIQFIITTHSPFILNSLSNVVIYDLEKKMLVEHGLADTPYSGIVEGYFNTDELSQELREKYERFKALVAQDILSDDDMEEISQLEIYLDEIPDYLALNITTDYLRLKTEFEAREDL